MKLCTIIFLLSTLVVLSTVADGYLYYTTLKKSAIDKVEHDAVSHTEMIQSLLSAIVRYAECYLTP